MGRWSALVVLIAGCVPLTEIDPKGKACVPDGGCGSTGYVCIDGFCELPDAGTGTTAVATTSAAAATSSGIGTTGASTGSAATTSGFSTASVSTTSVSSSSTSGASTSGTTGTSSTSSSGGTTGTTGTTGKALYVVVGQLGGCGYLDGVGNGARFDTPNGLAYDPAGRLYVADTSNALVRVIDLNSGVVSTFPNTSFYEPLGVADDGNGTLYVSDGLNEVLYAIDLQSNAVTSVAGELESTGAVDGFGALARFDEPAGLAWDPDAGQLFIADVQNNAIRKFDPSTQIVSTIAGTLGGAAGSADGIGAAASFSSPTGLVADGQGSLYVIDAANGTIRKIAESTGAVTTAMGTPGVFGNATGQGSAAQFSFYSGPFSYLGNSGLSMSLAYLPSGELLIPSGYAILSASTTTLSDELFAGSPVNYFGYVDGVGSNAEFVEPTAVVPDGQGRLYVSDNGGFGGGLSCTIRQIDLSSAAVTTAFGTEAHIGTSDGVGTQATFHSPGGVVSDLASQAYVADTVNSLVRQVDLDSGLVTTLANLPSAYVEGIALAMPGQAYAGTLFVTEAACGCGVAEVDIDSGVVTSLVGGGGGCSADACVYADGVGADAGFSQPEGIAYDGLGTLYVAESYTSVIRAIDIATATATTLAGAPNDGGYQDGPLTAARFSFPQGVALDGQGHLYVADSDNDAIRDIDLGAQTVSTLISFGSSYFDCPNGSGANTGLMGDRLDYLAYDGQGHLLVTDQTCGSVRQIDIATRTASTVVGNESLLTATVLGPLPAQINGPSGIALGPAGSWLIVDAFEPALLQVR